MENSSLAHGFRHRALALRAKLLRILSLRASIPCADTWGWWAGTSDEFMNIGGPYKSRDMAIKAGRWEQNGDPFHVCKARLHSWAPPSASSVLDIVCDNSDELFYDDGFPGFVGGREAEKAAEADLQRVLDQWFQRHIAMFPSPTVFDGTSNLEQIDAAQAGEAGTAETPKSDSVHEHAVSEGNAPEGNIP